MITAQTASDLLATLVRDFSPFVVGAPRADDGAALLRLNGRARWLSDVAGTEHTRRSLLSQISEQQRIAEGGVERERPLARQRAKDLREDLHDIELVMAGLMESRPRA